MASKSSFPTRSALGAAALIALLPPAAAQIVPSITVTGRAETAVGVGGFAEPLTSLPMQAAVYSAAQLRDYGIASLAGLVKLDAGLSDAYNSPGYWSQLTARGYVLDNRANYRRDGLPINAETALSLGNKERVEVLLGTSGMQAGTSAPGGIVNLVVKRPVASLREATIEVGERGSVAAHVDLSQRFGESQQFGVRLNAGAARLRPELRDADGRSSLVALALDWRVSPDSLLELEFESSRKSQPSMPGFSMLGDTLPDAKRVDPRLNLNNQPWSLPVVLDGDTASLRWTRKLMPDWSFTVHGATQRLRSDDRVAFPFGCYDAAADVYYDDRYCPDGSYDLYDFRSEGERRRVDALDVHADGKLRIAGMAHRVSTGAMWTRSRDRFNRQAYNYAGVGRVDGNAVTEPRPALTDENTNRDERTRELYVRDAIDLATSWTLWAGLRYTQLERSSVRTDGSRPSSYDRSYATPWLALSYAMGNATTLYASWGRGSESEVVPSRTQYDNRGEVLPATSRQWEVGAKHARNGRALTIAWFDIERPVARDECDADVAHCTRAIDGIAHHRGVDAAAELRQGAWTAKIGWQWFDARREGSSLAGLNGLRPVNVPRQNTRLQVGYDVSPAASVQALLSHEGRRAVLPDNTVWLPSWTRVDLAAQWRIALAGHDVRWRAGIDNVADRRAWREAPYQFSHVYLYPLAPRTWRLSASTSF